MPVEHHEPCFSILATTTAGRGNRGFGAQIAISGARPQQNNYRLDGISMNDYANGGPGSTRYLAFLLNSAHSNRDTVFNVEQFDDRLSEHYCAKRALRSKTVRRIERARRNKRSSPF